MFSCNRCAVREMGNIRFYVLGCRGTRPMTGKSYELFGGDTSCYIIKAGEHAVVLDCGTGLYRAEPYLQGCRKIDILITHLHYDHVLGFLHSAVFPENAQIRVYLGTDGEKDTAGTESFMDFLKEPNWPITPRVGQEFYITYGKELVLSEHISAYFARSNHPNNASVIRVDTDEGSMGLICDWEHGGESLPCTITDNCDFILYDGMFVGDEYEACRGWGHSTWTEGVKLAKEHNIPRLMITHHLPERTDAEILGIEAEAVREFPCIRFVRSGDCYSMKGEVISL